MSLSRVFSSLSGRYLSYTVIGFAIILFVLSIGEFKTLASNLGHGVKSEQVVLQDGKVGFAVSKTPLTEAQYQSVVDRLSPLYPDLEFRVLNGASVVITSYDKSDYGVWRMALFDLMNGLPGAVWEPVEICAGNRCGRTPYTASVTGYFQSVKAETEPPSPYDSGFVSGIIGRLFGF